MKRLIFLVFLILICTPVINSNAAVEGKNPKLLVDALTEEQVKDLNIIVPPETDSGFQVLTIQVYDDSGVQSERFVYFCKDLAGKIHWDNNCPGLEPLATKEELSKTYAFNSLPNYSPAQESKKSAGIIVAFVALLLILSSARNRFDEASSATLISLSADKKAGGAPIKRWGDRSITWRFPGYKTTDKAFSNFSTWVSRRSLIISRIFSDGDYGRAMFGSLWVLLPLCAPVLGYFAADEVNYFYTTPTMAFLLGMIALGIADALAGFIAAWTFTILILIKNPPSKVEEVLFLLAIALLGYAPVLIAAATRTFRRFTNNSQDRWNKMVDYFLAPVIAMWAVIKLVEGLNGFIGKQFLISYYALSIGIFTGFALLLRMFLEEFANRVYTWRIDKVSTEYLEQNRVWRFIGFFVEVSIGTYFAYKFSEWSYYLIGAIALGYLPKLISLIFDKKLPKSKIINYITPKGLFLTILLIYTASTFESEVRSVFDNSKEFLLWWIVIASVPAFIFAFFKLFAASTVSAFQTGPVTKYLWRLSSVACYFALLIAVFEVSPTQVSEFFIQLDLNSIFENIQSGLGL